MNDILAPPPNPELVADPPVATGPAPPGSPRPFDATAWLGFGVTTLLVLGGYLFTLTPDVTLGQAGVFATSAKYAGLSPPPGFPVWNLYGWLFTILLPFSNIAWRTAVASAVAGALTCGFVALLVSRAGSALLEGIVGFEQIKSRDRDWIRTICSCVAGLALGFDGAVWHYAIVPDAWPLSLLLFSITLYLLTKWSGDTNRRRCLYAACYVYGLTLANQQTFAVAWLGLQFFVLFADRELGRDLLFVNGLFFTAILLAHHWHGLGPLENYVEPVCPIHILIASISFLTSIFLLIWTRRFLTRWKTLLASGLMFLLGAVIYLYIPLASMTNPPVNWGYPRTVEGFLHAFTRGQYERLVPTYDPLRLFQGVLMYADFTIHEFGLVYLLAAIVPFFFLRKMRVAERNWLLGLLSLFPCLTILMLALLNPATGLRYAESLVDLLFAPSHLLLAIWAGLGLILLISLLARPCARPLAKPDPSTPP